VAENRQGKKQHDKERVKDEIATSDASASSLAKGKERSAQ